MWKTLIVDDSLPNRQLLIDGLSGKAKCDEAVDGNKAMDYYKRSIEMNNPYDFMLLDIAMPAEDGGLVLMKIREDEDARGVIPSLRAIIFMVTVHGAMRRKAFYVGCDGYFTKPVDVDKLIVAVTKRMEARKWANGLIDSLKGCGDDKALADKVASGIKARVGFENVSLRRFAPGNIDPVSSGTTRDGFLAAMSKKVVSGDFDTKSPFWTEHGAFWCGSLDKFLQSHISSKDAKARAGGYKDVPVKTVALFPLRRGKNVSGVLEITDSREGLMNEEDAREYELFALSLASILKT